MDEGAKQEDKEPLIKHGDSEGIHQDEISNSEPVELATREAAQTTSAGTDETSRLRELQADIRDQDDLERYISRQV